MPRSSVVAGHKQVAASVDRLPLVTIYAKADIALDIP
jgi:hypothetical protein